MAKKKTSPEPRPDTKANQAETLRNFECSLPIEELLNRPKGSIKSVKPKPERRPAGPSKMIQ